VIYTVDVDTATPQLRPDAAPACRSASVNPEHVAEVLVARSKLATANVPVAYPDGKVILIPCPAVIPVGVTNWMVWLERALFVSEDCVSERDVSAAANASCSCATEAPRTILTITTVLVNDVRRFFLNIYIYY
jgi:hypothetical protein